MSDRKRKKPASFHVPYQGVLVPATPLEISNLKPGEKPNQIRILLSDKTIVLLTVVDGYRINNQTDRNGNPVVGLNLQTTVET